MRDDDLDARVRRFEQEWRARGPRPIAESLAGLSGAGRHAALVELICVDLEFRWRDPGGAGAGAWALDDYVAVFPELVSVELLPLELVGEAYRVRRRWGDRPSHESFLARFRERRDMIRAELVRVDEEMEGESAGPSPAARYAAPAGPSKNDAGLDPDAPLLAHQDYLLRRLIGAGRVGKVYEARHHGSGREVAVKFLRKTFLHRPEVVRRFVGEARTVAGLRHPRIVGTEGLGRTPGGAYFLVMELVNGPDLARVCAGRAIGVGEAVRWAMEVCEALEHAHGRGVVHCDLKPANILLDGCGAVRVTDFGLARSLGGGGGDGDAWWTAEVEGTAPFMAPEQAARCWGPIDARTDVYGLGAVLFALLTGRPPFAGKRLADVLAEVVSARPVVSPALLRDDIPGPLSDLCRKCLSKTPGARYQSAREVGNALAGWRSVGTQGDLY